MVDPLLKPETIVEPLPDLLPVDEAPRGVVRHLPHQVAERGDGERRAKDKQQVRFGGVS